MKSSASAPERPSPWPGRLRHWAIKMASLVAVGVVFGCGYRWAATRCYRADTAAGFKLGTLHGALMPIALPALLLGRDVPIYAENNTGRSYKLGYIAGVNLCGFIFFGLAFWKPRRELKHPQEPRNSTILRP